MSKVYTADMETEIQASQFEARSGTRAGLSRLASNTLSAIASVVSSASAVVCPLCIPALAALVSSIGLGVMINPQGIRVGVLALLVVSIASLVWAAKLHGRWWVVASGALGAALVYFGRYVWLNTAAMWLGAIVLVGTSLANFRNKRQTKRCCCASKAHV